MYLIVVHSVQHNISCTLVQCFISGTLGVSDKMAQSTLSLHSFNSDSDNGRSRHGTLGRKFFKNNFFKPNKRDHLSPSSSLFYTKGISSSDVRQDEAPVVENIDDIDDIEEN